MRRYVKLQGPPTILLIVIGMIGASSALAKCPNMPRVEQITFKNSEEVVIDHQKNTTHKEIEEGKVEKPTTLVGFDGTSVHWKSPNAGEVTKNWPLAYVKGTEVLVKEIQLAVEPEAKTFFETEAEEPPKPTLTGETTIKGEKVKFTREYTLAEIKTQLAAHAKFLTTGELKTSKALPKEVFFEKIKIKWKWTVKEKGGATIELPAGESTHNLYVMNEKPPAGTEIFLTFLDLDTLGVEKETQPPSEAGVISGVWKGFTALEGGVPSVHIRVYEPKGAEPAINRSGTVLWYWGEVEPNKPLAKKGIEEITETEAQEAEAKCAAAAASDLLEQLAGRCDQWARVLQYALSLEGVKSEVLQLRTKFAGEEKVCEKGLECLFLVKNWTFGKVGVGEFPYAPSETTHTEGIAGQGVKNPPPAFFNHYIVRAGLAGGSKLYDPSYASAPYTGGATPTEKSVLEEFQTNSIAGFCRPAKAGEFLAAQTACQKTPAKLQLQALKENGTEGFTFP
jgi:hypothetical protein